MRHGSRGLATVVALAVGPTTAWAGCHPDATPEAVEPDARAADDAPAASETRCPEAWIPGDRRFHNATLAADALVHSPHAEADAERSGPWAAWPGHAPAAVAVPVLDTAAELVVVPIPGAEPDTLRLRIHAAATGALVHERVASTVQPPDETTRTWLEARGLLDGRDEVPLRAIELPPIGASREQSFEGGRPWTLRSSEVDDDPFDLDPMVRIDVPSYCTWLVAFGDEAYGPGDAGKPGWRLHARSVWADPAGRVAIAVASYERIPGAASSGHAVVYAMMEAPR